MVDRSIVLLLDDQTDNRETMRDLLQSHDLSVVVSANMESALKEIASNQMIDLVVTDINLTSSSSDTTGLIFANLIKRLNPSMPIAGYSGVVNAADIPPTDYRIFDAFLNKIASKVIETQMFAENCKRLALSHRQILSIAVKEGFQVNQISSSKIMEINERVDELSDRLTKLSTDAFKKSDIASYFSYGNIALGILGALASIFALYLAIKGLAK